MPASLWVDGGCQAGCLLIRGHLVHFDIWGRLGGRSLGQSPQGRVVWGDEIGGWLWARLLPELPDSRGITLE